MLHQPRYECEIGLAVRQAIFELRIRSLQPRLEVQTVIAQDLLDDVGCRHVLKKAAARRAREEPRLRAQNQARDMMLLFDADPLRLGHDAVEVPFHWPASCLR